MKKIKLGILGLSEGNGHPYSWAAIFNGYDALKMADCPFPVIPDYLTKQNYPDDFLGDLGEVTHIWTQDLKISEHVANASKIPYVCNNIEDMIDEVDAVLLARDDAENHYQMALPFLKAGLPVFIDKPLALTIDEANNIFQSQLRDNQVFSCSSLRFASELHLTSEDLQKTGEIILVESSVMKKWDTYAIHIIEPVVSQFPNRGKLLDVKKIKSRKIHLVMVQWENLLAYFKVTGDLPVPLEFKYTGSKGNLTKTFNDSFSCFRASLQNFVKVVRQQGHDIPQEETLEMVEIIERGRA